ncbi:MAG: response regulator transcription factor [Bacteroidetes bacterium]|nr:response regulator transcription factor [Bacteroidota bacterium]HNR20616.1 response regulator [Bacteroidia bacterium]HNU33156.1 response regulator [Bacteroidia bacterium]
MNKPLRIILQESDDDFRKQIEKEFATDARFVLLKSFKSFYVLKAEAHLFNTDVVLLNWRYPKQKLFDFIETSKKINPKTKVLVMFDFVQPDFVFKMLQCGADGFLLKPFPANEVFQYAHKSSFAKLLFHLDVLNNPVYRNSTSLTNIRLYG